MSPMQSIKTGKLSAAAFSLVEVMVATAIFGLVTAGTFGVYIMCQKLWRATTLSTDTSRLANLAIERMIYGLGTNSGLRSAATISIDTNVHTYMTYSNYWDSPNGSPPPANHWSLNLSPTWTERDGSWRIICSNAFDGVTWIDYVKKQRSIVMWPTIWQPDSRQYIANWVLDAEVSTNWQGSDIAVMVVVWKKDGNFVVSNEASALIKMRNK
ncbi:MAG: prepilin-type N-terminal cleavage/methylation domain-containing protein [Lentisphaerae bacterium]|nr:prepilin-type N-terminal cleavage/methylation domain-containing protein [Lentisphaerota bacterium]